MRSCSSRRPSPAWRSRSRIWILVFQACVALGAFSTLVAGVQSFDIRSDVIAAVEVSKQTMGKERHHDNRRQTNSCTQVHKKLNTHTPHTYIHIYTYRHIYLSLSLSIYIYIHMYVCINIYIYIYILYI